MRIKSRVLAIAATVATAATTITWGFIAVPQAGAATPSCGGSCINIYPKEYAGQSLGAPQFVTDVYRQAARVGQPIILFRASNSDPAEDFTYAIQAPVSDFYAAGLVSASVALRYGCEAGTGVHNFPVCPSTSVDDEAYMLEYAPYGVDSGLCVGVGSVPAAGTKVALEPCGRDAGTVWIEDTNPGDFSPASGFYAAISGLDTNYAQPYVMTYPAGAYPTDSPRVQLVTKNLTGFSAGVDNDTQLWNGFGGVLP